MAKKLVIKALGAMDATTVGATVATQDTPFARGFNALVNITMFTPVGASGVVVVQTSPDGTTWTTKASTTAGVATTEYVFEIELDNYIRAQPSVVFTSGAYNAFLTE